MEWGDRQLFMSCPWHQDVAPKWLLQYPANQQDTACASSEEGDICVRPLHKWSEVVLGLLISASALELVLMYQLCLTLCQKPSLKVLDPAELRHLHSPTPFIHCHAFSGHLSRTASKFQQEERRSKASRYRDGSWPTTDHLTKGCPDSGPTSQTNALPNPPRINSTYCFPFKTKISPTFALTSSFRILYLSWLCTHISRHMWSQWCMKDSGDLRHWREAVGGNGKHSPYLGWLYLAWVVLK